MNDIVVICYKYPPEYSGYGKQLKSLLSNLEMDKEELNINIITAYSSSLNEETNKLTVIPLESKFIKNERLQFYVFCFKLFFWLILNHKRYVLIHCIKAGPEAIVSNFTSKLFNKPLIIKIAQDELSSRELKSASNIKRFFRQWRHRILSTSENFIAISEEIAENIEEIISDKSKVYRIPNGVDDTKFKPVDLFNKEMIRKNLNLPVGDVIILFVGELNKRKGVHDLLNSIEMLDNLTRATIIFCGPKSKEIDIDFEIEKINRNSNNISVMNRGMVDNVEEYMKASDIFVLPSYSEGLPNVLLEAGSTGLALIATDIGGSRDIVDEGINGFIVPTGSPKKLSEALVKLTDNEALRTEMGKRSRSKIETTFSLKYVSNEYKNLYFKLLRKKRIGE